jgi:replication factor A1
MKITDIKSGQGKIDIEADVIEMGEIREISKFNRPLKVATAVIKDDSGEIQLSLWNQDAEKVKKGDKIKITNGFAKEFQGALQVTAGKFGKIEVVGKSEQSDRIITNMPSEGMNPVEDEIGGEDEEW